MSERDFAEWHRILSQRLKRETDKLSAQQVQAAAREKQEEAPPPGGPAPDTPPVTELSGVNALFTNPGTPAPSPAPEPARDQVTFLTPKPFANSPLPPDSKRLTAGWPAPQPMETMIEWSTKSLDRKPSDPAQVVAGLRQMSPQEERRAFEILRGGARHGRGRVVLALSVAASLAAAGIALAFSGFFGPDRGLRLAMDVAPPKEPSGGEGEAAETAGGASQTPPHRRSPAEGARAETAGSRPSDTEAPDPVASFAVQDGPTFVIPHRPTRPAWVKIGGPPMSLEGAPSAADGRDQGKAEPDGNE